MIELRGKFENLIGGIQIKNRGLGTLACIVYDIETNKPLGLTNRHILGYKKGSNVYQPSKSTETYNRSKIGKVYRKGGLGKRNDFAVFLINTDVIGIDQTNSIYSLKGKLTEFVEPKKGMKVMKVGQKTGKTYGIITSINERKKYIFISPNEDKPNEEISEGGDSGALWVTDEENFKAVGLHRSGEKDGSDKDYSFAIPISRVLSKLKIKLVQD